MDSFSHASLREQSIWKHVQTWIQTPFSMHSEGSPAKATDLFCCTAIMEISFLGLRRADEIVQGFRQRQEL